MKLISITLDKKATAKKLDKDFFGSVRVKNAPWQKIQDVTSLADNSAAGVLGCEGYEDSDSRGIAIELNRGNVHAVVWLVRDKHGEELNCEIQDWSERAARSGDEVLNHYSWSIRPLDECDSEEGYLDGVSNALSFAGEFAEENRD